MKLLALAAALSLSTVAAEQIDVNPDRSHEYQELLACALHLEESLNQVQYFLEQEVANELPAMNNFWRSSAEFWARDTSRCANRFLGND